MLIPTNPVNNPIPQLNFTYTDFTTVNMAFPTPFGSAFDGHQRFTSDEASRQGTGNSGSSEENIIPGGTFEGFVSEVQDVRQPQGTGNVGTDYPQTPQTTAFSGLGSSDYAFTPHHAPSRSISSAIRSISSAIRNNDERTRRMNMASPLSTPSKTSPLAYSMQPSAFHMMGMPITPVNQSFHAPDSERHVIYSQPVVDFSPGPPHYPHALALEGRMIASPREMHFPSPTALASSGSTEGSMFSSSSTAGFPGTPHMRLAPAYGIPEENSKDIGHQYPATPQPKMQFPPSSVGSSYFGQRQYHRYRAPHSEPMNRVAPSQQPSSVFAFQAPRLEAPVVQDVFDGNARHQHTGSLQFAIPSGAPSTRPLPIQSMSLPNHSVLESPVSPEGRSFQSESEDLDGFVSRRPSAVEGFVQSPRSPKKHIW